MSKAEVIQSSETKDESTNVDNYDSDEEFFGHMPNIGFTLGNEVRFTLGAEQPSHEDIFINNIRNMSQEFKLNRSNSSKSSSRIFGKRTDPSNGSVDDVSLTNKKLKTNIQRMYTYFPKADNINTMGSDIKRCTDDTDKLAEVSDQDSTTMKPPLTPSSPSVKNNQSDSTKSEKNGTSDSNNNDSSTTPSPKKRRREDSDDNDDVCVSKRPSVL